MAGLAYTSIEMTQPTVASEVTSRLHRPADSANLGLSQLRLIAATTLGPKPPSVPAETATRTGRVPPVAVTAEQLGGVGLAVRLLERILAQLASATASSTRHGAPTGCYFWATADRGVACASLRRQPAPASGLFGCASRRQPPRTSSSEIECSCRVPDGGNRSWRRGGFAAGPSARRHGH